MCQITAFCVYRGTVGIISKIYGGGIKLRFQID